MGSGNRFEPRWVGSGLVPFFSSKGYNLFVKIGAVCILLSYNRKKLVPKTVLSRVPSLTQWNSHIYLYLQKAETLSQFEYVHYYSNGDVLCVFFLAWRWSYVCMICVHDVNVLGKVQAEPKSDESVLLIFSSCTVFCVWYVWNQWLVIVERLRGSGGQREKKRAWRVRELSYFFVRGRVANVDVFYVL